MGDTATDTRAPFAAGQLLYLSQGEYSDYGVIGVHRVTVPFSARSVLAEYLGLNPEQAKPYHASESAFVAWLTNDRKVIEEITSSEWNIGEYGTFTPEGYPS